MANGISISKLRREIKQYSVLVHGEKLVRVIHEARITKMHINFLDQYFKAVPVETYDKIIRHLGIWEFHYEKDYSDCDDFAMAFKGRCALELGVNGVGMVIDTSSGHSYNIVLTCDKQDIRGESLSVKLLEPQIRYAPHWWKEFDAIGWYQGQKGEIRF